MDEQDTRPRVMKPRRRYSPEFKAKVLDECEAPGASIASVAISHGINPNLVHKWRWSARQSGRTDTFIALPVPASLGSVPATVQLTVQMGQGAVNIDWPLDAIDRAIPWLRTLMQ